MRLLSRVRGALAGIYINRILTVSDFIRRRDIDELYFPEAKTCTVHNGVDIRRFTPTESSPTNDPTVVFAGQLIPQKGVRTLLQAVQLLADSGFQSFKV